MNKIERINLHWDDIAEILNGFVAAVPHGTVESFQNPSILPPLDNDRVLRCLITAEMEWRLLGVSFADPFTGLEFVEEEDEDNSPTAEVFAARLL
jgi:hypothetical protein